MSFASINGTVLRYRVSGAAEGPPLVLVNSLGTSLEVWDDVLPLLGAHHRILTYDKRGHGLSGIPAGPYSINDHVADLVVLAGHCGFRQFALCGISIGGMIAIRLAARHPELVGRLVLCDTATRIGTDESWNERIALVEAGGMAAVAEPVLGRWVSAGYRQQRPAEYAGWLNMLERCPAEGYTASCAAVRDAELSADARAIAVPTLVLAGEGDVSTPPALVRQLADAIPGAAFRLIAGAGHVPSIEQPAALAALISEHLSEAAHA